MPKEINVDGYVDRLGIKLYGIATLVEGNTYVCAAEVDGCMCKVEIHVNIVPTQQVP